MELVRTNYSSGAPMEEKVGYSRMVKVGPFVYIGGTTSVQPDGTVYGEGSAYEQAKYIFEKFVKLLEQADSKKEDVIRVKGYATDMKYAPEIAKAYSEIFHDIKPLFTIVGTPMLNRPSQLVEIEMDAITGAKVE
ncbi:MAG: Rid family hydrolase [Lachnospiraceae bacterium]|nr:Rid family hydrolase [Lachnospiraceae bacterium]